MQTQNQSVELPILRERNISLYIKREDLIHPLISGNKFRKLKYNLCRAQEQGQKTMLTFGGAYSNHIAATAYAGNASGFKTIGVIRGAELKDKWRDNPTLRMAHGQGMQFHFISRAVYRRKENPDEIKKLKSLFGSFYLFPEGGSNALAVKGCEEIITEDDRDFDVICCPVGTGATMAGIINASHTHQYILGFPALKGDFLKEDIRKFVERGNWSLQTAYHFGGYAKVTETLLHFVNGFKEMTGIPLDPIYTGKMVFAILDMVKKGRFESNTKILAIHTGGLQSIAGMNMKLKKKNLPLIHS